MHELKPVLAAWASLWLFAEHVGKTFTDPTPNDRGLSDGEVPAPVRFKATAEGVGPRIERVRAASSVSEPLLPGDMLALPPGVCVVRANT